jgi:hypothetical protein
MITFILVPNSPWPYFSSKRSRLRGASTGKNPNAYPKTDLEFKAEVQVDCPGYLAKRLILRAAAGHCCWHCSGESSAIARSAQGRSAASPLAGRECAEGAASAAFGVGGQHNGPTAVKGVPGPPLALYHSSILLRPPQGGSRGRDGNHPAQGRMENFETAFGSQQGHGKMVQPPRFDDPLGPAETWR